MSDAVMPHCDSSILHAPGKCRYCDMYPDYQRYREMARIGFTDEPVTDTASPCPSDWFRDPVIRAAWPGNRAKP